MQIFCYSQPHRRGASTCSLRRLNENALPEPTAATGLINDRTRFHSPDEASYELSEENRCAGFSELPDSDTEWYTASSCATSMSIPLPRTLQRAATDIRPLNSKRGQPSRTIEVTEKSLCYFLQNPFVKRPAWLALALSLSD